MTTAWKLANPEKVKEKDRKYRAIHRLRLNRRASIRCAKNREIGRLYVSEYLKTHPCVDCGEADHDVLEFDHINGDKRRGVREFIKQGYGLQYIIDEIAKCEVRCANDHRRRHARERREAENI